MRQKRKFTILSKWKFENKIHYAIKITKNDFTVLNNRNGVLDCSFKTQHELELALKNSGFVRVIK